MFRNWPVEGSGGRGGMMHTSQTPPFEFFLYCVGRTWHAKAVRTPCKDYRQKTGVVRHFTSTSQRDARKQLNTWRGFFQDGAGFANASRAQ
jgi:hypothetical protein